MKKLFLIILIALPILASAQTIYWPAEGTQGLIKMPLTADTVVYGPSDVSGLSCSCTFDLSSLTSSVKISFGGSENIISTTYKTQGFQSFMNDSLPYTLSNTAWRDTTNARGGRIAQNIKVFTIYPIFGHVNPGIRVWKLSNTGVLKYNCIFFRPGKP